MTPDDGPDAAAAPAAPLSRRALRTAPVQTTEPAIIEQMPATATLPAITKPPAAAPVAETPAAGAPSVSAPAAPESSESTPSAPALPAAVPSTTSAPGAAPAPTTTALAWLDVRNVARTTVPTRALEAGATTFTLVEAPDLLARAPRRSPLRPGVLVPIALVALLAGGYAATTLLWPLHAIEPTVTAIEVPSVAAPAAVPAWPAVGSAAVRVGGIDTTLASGADAVPMTSIAKVVTALLVLEELPLSPGEQGPEYRFSNSDRDDYWDYQRGDESALDVPVGGVLTQYQLLEGMLIGSANNYADRLASGIWPSDAVYARAANDWLAKHGVPGVTITDPSGFDPGNIASPEALIPLAQLALANPVIAEIVAMPSVELPGAGLVANTNGLLADPGVVGIKTGSVDPLWNLLSAKDIVIGDTTVRLYASVLGQVDDASRIEASRALYAELELALQPTNAVAKGTVAGQVSTAWGEPVDIVAMADSDIILWNGGAGTVTTTFSLGDAREKGQDVGTLAVRGPLDSASATLGLAADIEPPTAWWRLTHPLELLGID